MVDRVYKADITKLKNRLVRLRDEFSKLNPRTDWTRLRIEPLLSHAEALEHQLTSHEFSNEFSRLRVGVVMFHSDLVYLRGNIRALEKILKSERKRR